NGTMLRIPRGKTKNARRYLAIKAPALRTRLSQLAADKSPDDLMFGVDAKGHQRSRQTLYAAVQRVCVAAGVPVVCPHSLKGSCGKFRRKNQSLRFSGKNLGRR